MDSSLFALAIGLRAAVIGGITFGLLELLATQRLYATALVLAGAGMLVLLDLRRQVAKADRILGNFVDGLAAHDFQRPLVAGRGFRGLARAIDRAVTALSTSRTERHQRIEYLQALLENVSAALYVLEDDGTTEPVNRAARRDVTTLGKLAAERLAQIVPGERLVLRLENGQRALASAVRFSSGGRSARLVSIQNVASELDAVELKAWRDLVQILAHEMMNSLTPVISLAESVRPLLRDGSEDVTKAVDTIARRSSGLLTFVDRYRRMADLPRPILRAVPIAEILDRVDRLMGPTLAQKGIAYERRVATPDAVARADPDLIEQVLINFLHNAIDAVATTMNPRIEVRCTTTAGQICIAVADNGCGLDETALERIFVPFFSTKPGGSGIGLSLARQIALAHHGHVMAERGVGRGAVFTLSLPSSGSH